MTQKRKVLIIGFDGATWDLMTPWIEAGHLPNLKRLVENGASGILKSTVHPVTTPAWTSFLTGQQQGKHGIYDHVHRAQGSYKISLTNASMVRVPLIFDRLGQHGLQSISLNVPYTFPPRPIPGIMVSGLFAPAAGPEIAEPPEIFAEIQAAAPRYVVHPDFDPQAKDPLQRYLLDYLDAIDQRYAAADYLLRNKPWDYFVTVFTATDQIQHAFWHFMEAEPNADAQSERFRNAILDVYRRLDQGLPRLLQHADEETLLFVISDHGAGRLHRWVHLNRWLADGGYLSFRSSKRSWRTQFLKGLAGRYKRLLPSNWRRTIRRRLGQRFDQAKNELESQLFTTPITWEQTRAYSLGACGNIFINLVGREPQGCVNPGADYEALRDEIIARLSQLRDPETGELIVESVVRREELYHGPYVESAPDLIVIWRDYRYWGRGRYDQNAPPLFESASTWDFSDLPLTGTHRPNGIVIAHGPGVLAGAQIDGAHLIDIGPTAMCYLGVPVPTDLDGAVLTDLFAPGFLQPERVESDLSTPGVKDFTFSESEQDKVMQRLTDLGYL